MVEESNKNDFDNVRTVNSVGVSKSKRLVIIFIVLGLGLLSYYLFFSDSNKKDDVEVNNTENINKLLTEAKPVAQETAPKITISPQLPELPPLIKPKDFPRLPIEEPKPEKPKIIEKPESAAPPIANTLPQLPKFFPEPNVLPTLPNTDLTTGYDRERRATSMLIMSNQKNSSDEKKDTASTPLTQTSAKSDKATKLASKLNMIIVQGKMLDAVLETAINSDLQGVVRGIISRDIYAEAGDQVMIPKGSRLVGNYSFDNKPGVYRININWERLILPHGIDIKISSSGTDELGRNGLTGTVDNKITNILTSAIALAGISVGTAIGVNKIPGMEDQTSVTDDNGKTTTTMAFNIISKAVQDFSDTIQGLVKKNINISPTIHIDQGTLIKVFVNQDLIFSQEALNGLQVIK